MRNFLLPLLCFVGIGGAWAQTTLPLTDLEGFKSPGENWEIVGGLAVDPNVDALAYIKEAAKPLSKKEQRRRKKQGYQPSPPVNSTPGTGILYNNYSPGKQDHLLTDWEHGDLKLSLDVMVPKGSNSGIYLQGRYEIQLLDSWGVTHPKYSDIGGLYRNWETQVDKIFMGVAPITNAAKAPGLWQHLDIHFQAPKFDAQGNKTQNARLVSVYLNGVLIHNNVEIPRPTGGPIAKNEVPMGPLMIQGDHGPVAFRNIEYAPLSDLDVHFSTLEYKSYKGDFKGLEELDAATPTTTGTAQAIDINAAGAEDQYGIVYNGILEVPKTDEYTFTVGFTGGYELLVDGKEVAKVNSSDWGSQQSGSIQLTQGKHQLTLKNIKSAGWRAPRLGLSVQTATSNPKPLHTYNSYPPTASNVSPIYVDAEASPRLLRAFVRFKGDGEKRSHAVGVGTPEGLNYVYDLKSGNMIGAWRGKFVDATPMWHNRGNGFFNPRGNVQWTFLGSPIAQGSNGNYTPIDAITPKGYTLDPATGLPSFSYSAEEVKVTHKISLADDNKSLEHQIALEGNANAALFYKLAEGGVQQLNANTFVVGDHAYYISISPDQQPTINNGNLYLPLNSGTISYKIIW